MGVITNFANSRFNPIRQLAAVNQNLGRPLEGTLWKGSPITRSFIPKAYAAPGVKGASTAPNYGFTAQNNSLNMPGYQQGYANNTGRSSGGGVPSTNQGIPTNQPTNDQGFQNIQSAQDQGNQQIEDDYNQSMGMLAGAEQGLQGQAGTAQSQITNDAAGVQTSLGAQQATQQQGVQSSLFTAEQQGTSAMQQARDLFRQTQQQNNAQLSALGISSSSVSEALAERLGVETARRIAGAASSLDEVRLNAVNELGRIKNYYAEKKTQLDENVMMQKDQIQQSLMQGLNQINSARSQAASDKAQARSSLLNQVQTSIYNLTTQQQQFDQQLKVWATQKSAALTPLTTNEGLKNVFQSFQQTMAANPGISQFNWQPQVNMDKYGQISGSISANKPQIDPITGLPIIPQTNQTNAGANGLF